MAITMEYIASQVGLTRPAVSNILANKGQRYRAETRERVLRVARELGYRTNAAARATATGKFGGIALLLSTKPHRSTLFAGLLDGIEESAAARDLHLTLAKLPDEKLTNAAYVPKILRQWMVDGLLINYSANVPQTMVSLIRRHDIPSIWLNFKAEADCVYPDDYGAAQVATEHLLRLGHRRIAFVDYGTKYGREPRHFTGEIDVTEIPDGFVPAHFSVLDRWNGYALAMRRAGLTPQIIATTAGVPHEQRAAFSARWLSPADRPTAVLTYMLSTAMPVIHAATTAGLRVPQDLSVMTFSDHVANDIGVAVTCMVLPERQMGRTGVERLLEKIDQPARVTAPAVLPLTLEAGVTCAPCAAR